MIMNKIENISGIRLMWMMVMFDLPTNTKAERKRANNFRNILKDNGFEMSQFSVYVKFIGVRENKAKNVRIVKANIPPGKVVILYFTDKQFSESETFYNTQKTKNKCKPEQLMLF